MSQDKGPPIDPRATILKDIKFEDCGAAIRIAGNAIVDASDISMTRTTFGIDVRDTSKLTGRRITHKPD